MKSHFTAGEAAKALGEDSDTLRQWRTRKLCLLGGPGERGYWQYTFQDVCRMAVAIALYRFGENLEIAMNRVAVNSRVAAAINRAVVGGLGDGDEILSFAAGVSPAGLWSSVIITNADLGDAADRLALQWEAHEGLRGCEDFLAEQIWQINVSRIVDRVGKLLGA